MKIKRNLRSAFIVPECDVDAKESHVVVVTLVVLVLDVVHVFDVVLVRKEDRLDCEAVKTRNTLPTFLKLNICILIVKRHTR